LALISKFDFDGGVLFGSVSAFDSRPWSWMFFRDSIGFDTMFCCCFCLHFLIYIF